MASQAQTTWRRPQSEAEPDWYRERAEDRPSKLLHVSDMGATPGEPPFPVEWQLPAGPVSESSDQNISVRHFGPSRRDQDGAWTTRSLTASSKSRSPDPSGWSW
jgi:hypothetical protein